MIEMFRMISVLVLVLLVSCASTQPKQEFTEVKKVKTERTVTTSFKAIDTTIPMIRLSERESGAEIYQGSEKVVSIKIKKKSSSDDVDSVEVVVNNRQEVVTTTESSIEEKKQVQAEPQPSFIESFLKSLIVWGILLTAIAIAIRWLWKKYVIV